MPVMEASLAKIQVHRVSSSLPGSGRRHRDSIFLGLSVVSKRTLVLMRDEQGYLLSSPARAGAAVKPKKRWQQTFALETSQMITTAGNHFEEGVDETSANGSEGRDGHTSIDFALVP